MANASARTDACQYGSRAELAIMDARQKVSVETSFPSSSTIWVWHTVHAPEAEKWLPRSVGSGRPGDSAGTASVGVAGTSVGWVLAGGGVSVGGAMVGVGGAVVGSSAVGREETLVGGWGGTAGVGCGPHAASNNATKASRYQFLFISASLQQSGMVTQQRCSRPSLAIAKADQNKV